MMGTLQYWVIADTHEFHSVLVCICTDNSIPQEGIVAIPKLSAVILNVADADMLRTCKDWYVRLGLQTSSSDEPGESVFFNTGNGALFAIHTAGTAGHSEVGVYFEVDDVEKLYEQLCQDGFVFRGRPQRQPWGHIAVWLNDPAGHLIALVTPC